MRTNFDVVNCTLIETIIKKRNKSVVNQLNNYIVAYFYSILYFR